MAVIVNMACGLANRMFQYSYYLYLRRLGYNAFVDFYKTAKLKHENVAWNAIFPHALLRQASEWEVFRTGEEETGFLKSVGDCFGVPATLNILQLLRSFFLRRTESQYTCLGCFRM